MATIQVTDHDGGVRVLGLDRPPANAIDETLLADLQAALAAASADEAVRAVVLTGRGAFFCGGFDLSAPPRDAEQTMRLGLLYRDAHVALLGCLKPTVALVNGHATAGGLVLVLACDYRLGVAGDHRVGFNEVAIGASFPLVAYEIAALRLAHARLTELILGAALYPAAQAVRLGIVDELFAPEVATATVLRRAARLGSFPREAYAHAKQRMVGAAIARVMAESPEDMARTAAVWRSAESRAARKRQREHLGITAEAE